MIAVKSLKKFYLKINNLLDISDKKFLFGLAMLSIVISLVETLGISAIMPFLSLINDPTLVDSNKYFNYIYNLFSLNSYSSFILLCGLGLILFYIFRTLINIANIYLIARFTNSRYHKIATKLFSHYLNLPYQKYSSMNSSLLMKNTLTEVANITTIFNSILLILSEVFVIIFIYGLFLYIEPLLTLFITLALAINVFIIVKFVSKVIKEKGVERASIHAEIFEVLNSSFANYKMLKSTNSSEVAVNKFSDETYKYSRISIITATLKNSPRLIFEGIAFSLIIGIIMYLVYIHGDNAYTKVGMLSAFVLGLYRLMPSVNRIVSAYNDILYQLKALELIVEDFRLETEKLLNKKVSFNNKIHLESIRFSYGENKVLKNINLDINKGDKIAFKGMSGGGKSTLVDIIMGMLNPSAGSISVDGIELNQTNLISWRSHFGYIPQNVYLFDGTVAENVVFNREYNEAQLVKCLKQAKIYDYLISKEGLKTNVGEGGIQLSGGQKQRIAIARALYMQPDILVLDEATSALDDDTEKKIMNEIYEISSDKTLIIIAHRISTLIKCNRIYELANGEIIDA